MSRVLNEFSSQFQAVNFKCADGLLFLPQTFLSVQQHGGGLYSVNGCCSDVKTSDQGLDDTATCDERSVGINAEICIKLKE